QLTVVPGLQSVCIGVPVANDGTLFRLDGPLPGSFLALGHSTLRRGLAATPDTAPSRRGGVDRWTSMVAHQMIGSDGPESCGVFGSPGRLAYLGRTQHSENRPRTDTSQPHNPENRLRPVSDHPRSSKRRRQLAAWPPAPRG